MTQFLNGLFILLADYATPDAAGNTQEYVRKSVEVSHLLFKVYSFFVNLNSCNV